MNEKIEEIKERLHSFYRCVEMPSDEPVQFVGVYVLSWNKVSDPSVGFVETDDIKWLVAEYESTEKENEELRSGENDWWQRRWINKDTGEQLLEIRKKWLTAYQCAESYQKMYEEKVKEIEKLQRIVACVETAITRAKRFDNHVGISLEDFDDIQQAIKESE